jgi:hypothetical protein
VETTADVLRRLAKDLDEDYDGRCGHVAVNLIGIGLGIVRERWLLNGVAQAPAPSEERP